MKQSIPVVDLKDFIRGTPAQRADFVQVVGDALCDIGFFAVENHQIDEMIIQRAYALMEQFLPDANKRKYVDPNGMGQRGFTQSAQNTPRTIQRPTSKSFGMSVKSYSRVMSS